MNTELFDSTIKEAEEIALKMGFSTINEAYKRISKQNLERIEENEKNSN